MSITAQGREVPLEHREIDIATVPIKELREYKEQLGQRWKEVANAPNYSPHMDIIDRYGMLSQAIGARERGLEVEPTDRATFLNTEQKAAERLLNAPGVRERLEAQDRAYFKEHGYPEPTREAPRPVSQLSKAELVGEAREVHAHFGQLSERYREAPPAQRAEIRQEMEPLVHRERELRQEFSGRQVPELKQDRGPDQQIAYSR